MGITVWGATALVVMATVDGARARGDGDHHAAGALGHHPGGSTTRTVHAVRSGRRLQDAVSSIVDIAPQDRLDATADGRYAAWLEGQPP